MYLVRDFDVFRDGRKGICRSQDFCALGHEQFQPDGVNGDHVCSYDQALVIPDVPATEVMGASAMELWGQCSKDMQAKLPGNLRQSL